MARLIRMDTTGHATLAEWTAGHAEAEGERSPRSAERSRRATTRW